MEGSLVEELLDFSWQLAQFRYKTKTKKHLVFCNFVISSELKKKKRKSQICKGLNKPNDLQVVVGTFVSEEEKSRSLDSEGSLPSDVQGLNVNAPAAPGMHHSMNQSLAKFENPSHSHGSTTQQHPPHPQTHGVFHPVSWTGSDTRHNSYVNISLPGD